MAAKRKAAGRERRAEAYQHPDASSPLRPDVGTQAQFRKKKPKATWRYDSSLAPELNWDGQNPARELGEWLLKTLAEAAALPPPHQFPEARTFTGGPGPVKVAGLQDAADLLGRLGAPILNWAGKAERLSFDVPTLPLFVHERLSTRAILETLKGHERDRQMSLFDLFADPQRPVHEQVLKAYEYQDGWVNRMILGDSLTVMNSLLGYESLGGQVQMIYLDPPYGVKFGSNFQPFVRKTDVRTGDDDDMSREPEMVKAYRDTWELGLHSYLTYLRDRLLLARDLLAPSGSIFVQISDENLHHVREVMDEVFGAGNFVSQITFLKTSGFATTGLSTLGDFLLWYARDKTRLKGKVKKLFERQPIVPGEGNARWLLLPDGTYRGVTAAERRGETAIPEGARFYEPGDIAAQGAASAPQPFEHEGKTYHPGANAHWKANYPVGMERLAQAGRLHVARNSLRYRRFAEDFPYQEIGNVWTDTRTGNFTEDKLYVVQTGTKVVERCLLLTTDPGDLVLDPTCGSGTTAYAAEKWGRRWITIDTSRVPLALARQRLLTATYDYHELKEPARGPGGGFVYRRRQNQKGEEVGGIVPHITLESFARDEPPKEEVLADRPETASAVVRVTGPFMVEATIPTPVDWEGDGEEDSGVGDDHAAFTARMIEVLRRSPVLHVGGGQTVGLRQIRVPAKTLTLSAEAMVDPTAPGSRPGRSEATEGAAERNGDGRPASGTPVALVFGPENGAVSEKLVYEAAREAHAKSYSHLYVIGFAVQPDARKLIETCDRAVGVSATYVQATPDLMMGDLLKNMRSSQIFSVCGLPEVRLVRLKPVRKGDPSLYQVELVGLDVFDPATMETDHRSGDDVPVWFLDTDYNDLCFHVTQAFFPRTGAWDAVRKSLKAVYDETVWDHLAGAVSAPFEAGGHDQIAVKVIDDRGNELMVVKKLQEAEGP